MSDLEPTVPVATVHGQVRGLRKAGVSVFKGMRYGADTGGANRFRPPAPVIPWSGVQDAFEGPVDDVEILHLKQRRIHGRPVPFYRRSLGSRESRNPSPNTLSANTTMAIASPG